MRNKHNSSPQYIRTDRAIMQAFIELLNSKSFESISVQDILEQTPVTRATFYAHYHDKYDIAEQMLAQFLQLRDELRLKIKDNNSSDKYFKYVKEFHYANYHLISALLKIRTETVDLRQTLINEFINQYLSKINPEASLLEARIYATVYTEMYTSFSYNENKILSFEESNKLITKAFLGLLRLHTDEESIEYIQNKLNEKFNFKK